MDKRLYMLDTVTLYDCELISQLRSFYEEISFKGMAAGLSIQNVHISKGTTFTLYLYDLFLAAQYLV
jgi:hypothetical protein